MFPWTIFPEDSWAAVKQAWDNFTAVGGAVQSAGSPAEVLYRVWNNTASDAWVKADVTKGFGPKFPEAKKQDAIDLAVNYKHANYPANPPFELPDLPDFSGVDSIGWVLIAVAVVLVVMAFVKR